MLQLSSVSFSYGKKELFKDLNLNIKPGNIYGLLGKNGAGKTTLLKILAGLLFPVSGDAIYDGHDISKREPTFLEEIFFLPEEFFLPAITGRDFIKLRSPLYKSFDNTMFQDFIEEFDVDCTKKLNTLSYGQKKKFLLSFGLATGAKLIIMDEPTNALDIPSKTILRRIISRAMSDERTIIISTHQVKDVENLIDPIIILDKGSVVFNKSTMEITDSYIMKVVPVLRGDEIYSQEVLGGYQVVAPRNGEEETLVDLELLFNSVVLNSKLVKEGV